MIASPTVSLCILSHQRQDALADALRSARGEGFLETIVLDNASDPPLRLDEHETLVRSEANLGISAGRNRLAEIARGDVLLFMDDDAVLRPGVVAVLTSAFRGSHRVGAVALRIERPGGTVLRTEQPFRLGRRAPLQSAPCAYFIGAGFAVRRDAYLAVGGGEERFFYGTDDIELAFRLLQAGWDIRYEPQAQVEHRPSPHGRLMPQVMPGHHLRNRVLLARRYLPQPVLSVHVAAWATLTAVEAFRARGLRPWAQQLRSALREPVVEARLPSRRLLTIHRLGGRVLF